MSFLAPSMQCASPLLSSWIFVHPRENVQTAKIFMIRLSPSSYFLPRISKYAPYKSVPQRTRCLFYSFKTRGKTVAIYTAKSYFAQSTVINIRKCFSTKRSCTGIITIKIINIIIRKYEHCNKCLS